MEEAKRGQARGKGFFKRLTKYVQKKGTRKSTKSEATRPRYDKEFFLAQCKLHRGWETNRAECEWNRLIQNPANIADNNGPEYAKLRIFVPTWIFCTEADVDATENFAEKSLDTETKARYYF